MVSNLKGAVIMGKCFRVIELVSDTEPVKVSLSRHAARDRRERLARVAHEVGLGEVERMCVVDTGHPAGYELHVLTTTGVVLVLNERTRRLVTVLIARPGQVRRYYAPFGEEASDALIARAFENTSVHHWNR